MSKARLTFCKVAEVTENDLRKVLHVVIAADKSPLDRPKFVLNAFNGKSLTHQELNPDRQMIAPFDFGKWRGNWSPKAFEKNLIETSIWIFPLGWAGDP